MISPMWGWDGCLPSDGTRFRLIGREAPPLFSPRKLLHEEPDPLPVEPGEVLQLDRVDPAFSGLAAGEDDCG